jgi:predicted alpha/beta superfamily hydrolase
MKKIFSLFVVLVAPQVVAQEPIQADSFQGLADIRHHQIESKIIGKRYEIMVSLPDGYDESPDHLYPTIYVTDGAGLLPLLLAYYRYLNFGEEVPDTIFVAISYSDGDWINGSDRSHDYSAVSDKRDDYGGAGDFQAMIRDEIMPLVEKQYRSRADRRVLFGQSMGGQFVMYTAHTEPDLFWGHIASNPALHNNVEFFLPSNTSVPKQPVTRLFVTSASHDAPRFKVPATEWMNAWLDRPEKPWVLHIEEPQGHNHYSVPPVSFRLGMKWLFADELD